MSYLVFTSGLLVFQDSIPHLSYAARIEIMTVVQLLVPISQHYNEWVNDPSISNNIYASCRSLLQPLVVYLNNGESFKHLDLLKNLSQYKAELGDIEY